MDDYPRSQSSTQALPFINSSKCDSFTFPIPPLKEPPNSISYLFSLEHSASMSMALSTPSAYFSTSSPSLDIPTTTTGSPSTPSSNSRKCDSLQSQSISKDDKGNPSSPITKNENLSLSKLTPIYWKGGKTQETNTKSNSAKKVCNLTKKAIKKCLKNINPSQKKPFLFLHCFSSKAHNNSILQSSTNRLNASPNQFQATPMYNMDAETRQRQIQEAIAYCRQSWGQ